MTVVARLFGRLERSRANGPGRRAVVWFQGCTLACRDCFNPESHARDGGEAVAVADLLAGIRADVAELDGVTISGGEPFQQPEALRALLAGLRARTWLSTLVFTGYSLEEIEAQPLGPACLALIDVLVAGRYVPARHAGAGLIGSANQRVHLLTPRHSLAELGALPDAELQIEADGRVRLTGIAGSSLAVG